MRQVRRLPGPSSTSSATVATMVRAYARRYSSRVVRCAASGAAIPESIHPKPELAYDDRLCSGAKECGLCLKAPFPEGAFFTVPGADDKVRVNWDLASDCDQETVSLCPTKALYMFGATMTADEVLDEVEKDASFYRTSGGGMTLSGGEAAMFPDFATALLQGRPRARHQHRDRNGGQRPVAVPGTDAAAYRYVLHDLKVMDEERHKKWTGVGNKRLLENFKKAYETFPERPSSPAGP